MFFSGDGKLTDWAGYATGVVIQPDGKIVAAGGAGPRFSTPTSIVVARFTPDEFRRLYQLWQRHHVLVLRDQRGWQP